MKNDLISRQAAIGTFGLSEKTRKYGGDHSGYDTRMLYEIQNVLEDLPSVDAIPVEWIEKNIEWLVGLDNAFSGLAAISLRAMLASWRNENGGDDQKE